MIIGYARVSTHEQSLDAQIDAVTKAGAERIFSEKVSAKAKTRPELEELKKQLRAGDVVVVTKYDRLARSLKEFLEVVELIEKTGAGFRSLAEDIDTTTPAGRLAYHIYGSIAEFERERISERTREGLEAAKRRGRVGGRPKALKPSQVAEIVRLKKEGRRTAEIADLFKVSASTVRRV